MVNRTPSELWELSLAAQKNSQRWYGENDLAASLSHMTLALCGEVGSLANIVKLVDRGEISPTDAHAHFDMIMKLADAFIYTLNIAALLKVDLLRAYEQKVIQNEKRFVDSKEKKEARTGWRQLEYTGDKE